VSRLSAGREVVLEGSSEDRAEGVMTPAVVRRRGDTVEVTATAQTASVLVLNEALFSGVRAFEGEREQPVLRANHVVRGVMLEPGAHTVRFTFETPGLRVGALITTLSLALGAAFAVRRRRQR
jgi:uncharacterized membrane protein YfhO